MMIRAQKEANRFFLDNILIDGGVVLVIGRTAALVYISLCRHANYKTQICFPSQKKIAAELGMSVRNVRRGIKKLIVHKLIERKQIGKKCNNRYFLIDRTVWVKETRTDQSSSCSSDCPTTADTDSPLHSKDTHLKEKKEKSNSTSFDGGEENIISQNEKWSHNSFLRWLYNTGKWEDKILLYYIWIRDFNFPNEIGANKFYKENIVHAKALHGYEIQTIKDTIFYLKKECKWMKKWTLGSVLKFVNDVDSGNICLEGKYNEYMEELLKIVRGTDSKKIDDNNSS